MSRSLLSIAVLMTLFSSLIEAHHSTSRFDSERTIEIDGIVTDYEWANPHVYITVRAESGESLIEGYSPSTMGRVGWSADMLAIGERVVVTANPERNGDAGNALLVSISRADETLFNLPDAFAQAARLEASGSAASLDGNWVTAFDPGAYRLFSSPAASLSLTERGRQSVEEFEEDSMLPGIDCTPITAPSFMVVPDTKQIEVRGDTVVIISEYEGVSRTVHMNPPDGDDVPVSLHGYSIGRWEGADLLVTTTRFAEHRVGNAFRLASSPQKHLIERFSIDPGGESLTYSFELTDPVYLAEPVVGELKMAYRPDLAPTPAACDALNAGRFRAY